jgi:hypothetical protein
MNSPAGFLALVSLTLGGTMEEQGSSVFLIKKRLKAVASQLRVTRKTLCNCQSGNGVTAKCVVHSTPDTVMTITAEDWEAVISVQHLVNIQLELRRLLSAEKKRVKILLSDERIFKTMAMK